MSTPAPDTRSRPRQPEIEPQAGDPALVAASANGGLLAYREFPGSGISILDPLSYAATLAGLEQARSQRDFIEALSAGRQLVYFDQRGSGGSAAAGVPCDWEQRASDLWAVADAAGVERAVLYGVFDAGATIACAAAQQPERVLGLIFNRVPAYFAAPADDADGSPAASLPDWFAVNAGTPHGQALKLMDAVAIPPADAETLVRVWEETARPDVIARHEQLLAAADLRPLLPGLTVPALVLASKRRPTLAAWGGALGRLLPCARVVYPENAGEALGAMHAFLAILGADI
ncbi:MAG: alpha/beta fold hydrolase, partial [Dehalococcoidia bacterium]